MSVTRPLRSKRNFKSLQLDVSNASTPPPPEPDPVPTRLAPTSKPGVAGGAKKRPPPMNLKPKPPTEGAAGGGGGGGVGGGGGGGTGGGDAGSAVDSFIAIAPAPTSAPASGTTSASTKRMTYHTALSNTLANLDLNAEVKYDLRDEDLKDLYELGQGNGGSVKKVEHVPTHTIMAKKVCLSRARAFLSAWCCFLHNPGVLTESESADRLFLSMQNHPSASRSCASYTSCMIAIRNTSFRSSAHSFLIPTFASAWSSWTRVP